jgi:hypothetical protein
VGFIINMFGFSFDYGQPLKSRVRSASAYEAARSGIPLRRAGG